ncbi:STAS domain-containing protein [Colwellia psychrerythraea]|uniref:Anti-sigma-factor antagonist n=1 Tax=Colwellia psychrerythraea TaxID=28229 RepID=A0A099K8F0_COLPS|nr:STAS domain-containing protein [Colwellia psychrerythraea]KGJ86555.1 anti-sigma-factor antagonist [Colwellia psychrerythraea]
MLNETYKINNDFIITLHGNFDADTVNVMKDDIEAYSKLSTNIIFDLEQVPFIDSSGIGAIVFLYKRMVAKGFSVSVTGLTQQPLELFEMLFLDKTINCYPNISCYLETSPNLQVAS